MSGDVWEYLILGALIWIFARRLHRAPETRDVPGDMPWWDHIP